MAHVESRREFSMQPTRGTREARRRFLIRQWIPGRPIHAFRVGVLGSIRHEDNDGRAGLRPVSLPDRFRYRRCPQRSRCPQLGESSLGWIVEKQLIAVEIINYQKSIAPRTLLH
jgi:hypothetical protein